MALRTDQLETLRRKKRFSNNSGSVFTPNHVGSLVAWWRAEQGIAPDNAAIFSSASSESFLVADNTELSTGDVDFCVFGWCNPTDLAATRCLLSKEDSAGSAKEYSLFLASTGNSRPRLSVYDTGGAVIGQATGSATNAVTAGQWSFFYAYHDSINNQVGVSINGAAENTAATSGVPSDTTASFRIATRISALSLYNGALQGVGFMKRLLTAAEITELMAAASYANIGAGIKNNLIAYWPLNEFSDGTSAVTRRDAKSTNHLTDTNTVPSTTGGPITTQAVDGDVVSKWSCTTTGCNAVQQTTAAQPLYKTNIIGGKAAVLFDGTDDLLSSDVHSFFTGSDMPMTVVAVIKKSGNAGVQSVVGLGNAASATQFFSVETNASSSYRSTRTDNAASTVAVEGTATPDTNAHIVSYIFTGTTMTIYVDGALDKIATAMDVGVLTLDRAALGALIKSTTSQYFNGYMSEIIIYSKSLNASEVNSVENYLSGKYGVTVS